MTDFELYQQKFTEALTKIGTLEQKYGSEAVAMQRQLHDFLTNKLIEKLDVVNGQIVSNAKNYQLLKSFDKTWNDYTSQYFNASFLKFGDDLVGVTLLSNDYLNTLNLPNMAAHYAEAKNLVLQQIGMTLSQNGHLELVQGGYISKLAQGQEVSLKLRKLVAQNITVGASYKDFYTKFKDVIVGNPQVDGVMQKYFRTYVYDTFSGVQASYDNFVARSAGMNSFVYAGTTIADTREFCRVHVNHVYKRTDIGKFEKQNWAGKNHDVPFIVSRGGYNCRHQLMWVPDEMASTLEDGTVNKPVKVSQPKIKTGPAKPKPIPPPKVVKDPKAPVARNFDEAKMMYSDAVAKGQFTSDQMAAFNSYQGIGYRGINKRLRHFKESEVELSQGNKDYLDQNITHMRAAFNSMPKTEGTLYRGSNLSDKTYKDLMAQVDQGYVRDKGFSSATFDDNTARHFITDYNANYEHPNEVWVILKAKGKNGMYFGNTSEQEVLFRDNAMFKVNKVEKVQGFRNEFQTRIYIEEQ